MSPFENIIDTNHGLSHEEKLKLRSLLDEELKASAIPADNGAKRSSALIGLFADEPELIDRVLESVCEGRSRPLRLNS